METEEQKVEVMTMKPEKNPIEDVLEQMSQDAQLNEKMDAFRQLKNPSRVQKARMDGLVLHYQATQAQALDMADPSRQPEALEKTAAPVESVSDEMDLEIPAFVQKASPDFAAEEMLAEEPLPKESKTQVVDPFDSFGRDVKQTLQENLPELSRKLSLKELKKRMSHEEPQDVWNAAAFTEGRLPYVDPEEVLEDPSDFTQWPVEESMDGNQVPDLEAFLAEEQAMNPAYGYAPQQPETDFWPEEPSRMADFADGYEEPIVSPRKGSFLKAFVRVALVMLVSAGLGLGAFWYLHYGSPDRQAYRELAAQIETYAAEYPYLDEAGRSALLQYEEQFHNLRPSEKMEINRVLEEATGQGFVALSDALKLEQRRADLENQIAGASQNIAILNDQLEQASAQLEEARQQAQEAGKAASQARKNAEKAENKVASLTSQIERSQNVIAETSQTIVDLQSEMDALQYSDDLFKEFKIEWKRQQLNYKQNSLASAQETLVKQQEELGQYQLEAQQSALAVSQQEAMKEQLESTAQQLQANYDGISSSLKEAKTNLASLEKQLNALS